MFVTNTMPIPERYISRANCYSALQGSVWTNTPRSVVVLATEPLKSRKAYTENYELHRRHFIYFVITLATAIVTSFSVLKRYYCQHHRNQHLQRFPQNGQVVIVVVAVAVDVVAAAVVVVAAAAVVVNEGLGYEEKTIKSLMLLLIAPVYK